MMRDSPTASRKRPRQHVLPHMPVRNTTSVAATATMGRGTRIIRTEAADQENNRCRNVLFRQRRRFEVVNCVQREELSISVGRITKNFRGSAMGPSHRLKASSSYLRLPLKLLACIMLPSLCEQLSCESQ
jgi:hypothetical protein